MAARTALLRIPAADLTSLRWVLEFLDSELSVDVSSGKPTALPRLSRDDSGVARHAHATR